MVDRSVSYQFDAQLNGFVNNHIYLAYSYVVKELVNGGTVCQCKNGNPRQLRTGQAIYIPSHQGTIVGFAGNTAPVHTAFSIVKNPGKAHQPQQIPVGSTIFQELFLDGDGPGDDCARMGPGQTLSSEPSKPTNAKVRGNLLITLQVLQTPATPGSYQLVSDWQSK